MKIVIGILIAGIIAVSIGIANTIYTNRNIVAKSIDCWNGAGELIYTGEAEVIRYDPSARLFTIVVGDTLLKTNAQCIVEYKNGN